MPDSRPNLVFDDAGNCNCKFTNRNKIVVDWIERENEFLKLLDRVSLKGNHDCVIPVSGGKDSTWQTIMALKFGLRPLCVTWRTPGRNSLGQANLNNLINLGVDHFDITVNPLIDRKVVKLAFIKAGSPAIPMHRLIRGIPLRVAQKMAIPIVLDGENSAYEYGGNDASMGGIMDNEWIRRYGVVEGIQDYELEKLSTDIRQIDWYRVPDLDKAHSEGVSVLFMGYFFEWTPEISRNIAMQFGFQESQAPKVGVWNFADIDDDFIIPVHHWMKWFKFGFTRRWDNLSSEIREGKLSRKEAIEIIRDIPEEEPREAIEKFIEYISITRKEFDEVCDSFRNRTIWSRDHKGNWQISNFLLSST